MHFTVFYRGIILYGWAVLVMTLLLTPFPVSQPSNDFTVTDKIVHAIIFGILSFLLFYFFTGCKETAWLKKKTKKNKAKNAAGPLFKVSDNALIFFYSFAITALYSEVLELAQDYVPGRSSSDADLIASLIGVALVLAIIYGDGYYKKT